MNLFLTLKLDAPVKQLGRDDDPDEAFEKDTEFVKMLTIIFGFEYGGGGSVRNMLSDKFGNVDWGYSYTITARTDLYGISTLKMVVDAFCTTNDFRVTSGNVDVTA